MGALRDLALKVPAINRLWSDRNALLAERENLRRQVQTASAGVAVGQSPFFNYNTVFDPIALVMAHARTDLVADPNYATNFLGVKISPSFFPDILKDKAGTVEGVPVPANWHADLAEWGAALRAVELSKDSFRVAELGCGWACWLNMTGVAARNLGRKVELIGIEGDKHHVQYALESLPANGFTPDQYKIVHGVAAPTAGKALFPVVDDPGGTWGSAPVLNATPAQIAEAESKGGYLVLDAYPLAGLINDRPLDLLHIDIQGGETDFVRDNIATINRLVRYMLIGTHSREIEGDLMKILLGEGWILEIERPAIFNLHSGRPVTDVDGVQGWRNPKICS